MKSVSMKKASTAFSTSRNSPKRYTSSTLSRSERARRPTATSSSRGGGSRTSSGRVSLNNIVEHVTPADGNIFEDLGFPPAEAAQMLLQADLAISVKLIIKNRKLTRAHAAKVFGVAQSRINDLLKGRLEGFDIDTLVKMLARAGIEIELTIKNRAA